MNFGKKVGDALYVHRSGLWLLPPDMKADVERAIRAVHKRDRMFEGEIIKITKEAVSLLNYPNFFSTPFPELRRSFRFELETGRVQERRYSEDSPPILHRKELMVPPASRNSKHIKASERLTRRLEELGAFYETRSIGTKAGWARRLKALGITVDGNHRMRKVGR